MSTLNRWWLSLAIFSFVWSGGRAQEVYEIDPEESRIEIHLETSGLLGFLGDEHFIEAPVSKGKIIYHPNQVENSSVTVEIQAQEIKVLDPHLEEKDRKEVQQTMAGDRVLHLEKYPRLSFESTAVRQISDRFLIGRNQGSVPWKKQKSRKAGIQKHPLVSNRVPNVRSWGTLEKRNRAFPPLLWSDWAANWEGFSISSMPLCGIARFEWTGDEAEAEIELR